jgi:hypothetical protein
MKKIIGILTALMMCFTLSSCVTTAQAQVDDMYDDVDIEVVVTYGTPYYNTEGLLLYYIYRDLYYYPYFYHDRYYLHRYYRPLPPNRMGRYRPVPRDFYRYSQHHRYHNGHDINHHPNRHHNNHNMRPNRDNRPHNNVTPRSNNHNRMGGNRPTMRSNSGGMRPMTPRSSTRPSGGFGGGHRYGGRR